MTFLETSSIVYNRSLAENFPIWTLHISQCLLRDVVLVVVLCLIWTKFYLFGGSLPVILSCIISPNCKLCSFTLSMSPCAFYHCLCVHLHNILWGHLRVLLFCPPFVQRAKFFPKGQNTLIRWQQWHAAKRPFQECAQRPNSACFMTLWTRILVPFLDPW
jgi:hypothetical protein